MTTDKLTNTTLPMQYADEAQHHAVATLGMWVFLVSEVMFFGGMFTGFFYYHSAYPDAFAAAGGQLNVTLGAINTAVLLTSSMTMAFAVHLAEVDRVNATRRALFATMVLGLLFLGIKAYEYYDDYTNGIVPVAGFHFENAKHAAEQLFYSFYFTMTVIHALHLTIGVFVVGYMIWRLRPHGTGTDTARKLEVAGLYWHFVDIVWIFLFPVLYLLGRHG